MQRALPPILLLLAIFASFGPVLPGQPIVDDNLWLNQPPPLNADWLRQTLTGWGFQNTELDEGATPFFRPVGRLILGLVHQLLGDSVAAWHGFSLALHGLNSLLLWLLLARVLPSLSALSRLLLAGLFALHPASAEAVLWISANNELLAGSWLLLMLLAYWQWRDDLGHGRLAVLGLLLLCGAFSKETALSGAMLVLGHATLQRRAIPWRAGLWLGGTVLLILALRQSVIGSLAGQQPLAPNLSRLLEMTLAHLQFLLLPHAPPFALAPPELPLAPPWLIVLALALLSGLIALAWRAAGRDRLGLALLWLIGGLWPAWAVALVGEGHFAARHAYPAAMGLVLLIGLALSGLPTERQRWIQPLLAGLLLACIGFTLGMALDWRDNLTIYQQASRVSPSADGPLVGQAVELERRGQSREAMALYRRALPLARADEFRVDYLYQLGSIAGQSGDLAASRDYLQRALALNPRHSPSLVGLGNLAWMQNRLSEAARYYRQAISADPNNQQARQNLAGVMAKLRNRR